MVAAAIVGGAVIGGVASNMAAKKGSDAAGEATDLQRNQYDQTRADQAPWRQAGQIALNQIVSGLGGDPAANQPAALQKTQENFDRNAYLANNPDVAAAGVDPYFHYLRYGQGEGRTFTFTPEALAAQSSLQSQPTAQMQGDPQGEFNRSFTLADFQKDPGYEFRLNQGLDAVQGSRAAKGSMFSGATLKALQDYGSDYASSEYGKAYDRFNNDRTQRFNRLATVAGIGQTATNNVGTAGANFAKNASSNIMSGANASAAGTIGVANSINGGLSNLQSLYQLNNMNKKTVGNQGYGNTSGYYGSDFDSDGSPVLP